jgi:hypothetical protein
MKLRTATLGLTVVAVLLASCSSDKAAPAVTDGSKTDPTTSTSSTFDTPISEAEQEILDDIEHYATVMERTSGIGSSVWECVTLNTVLNEWVIDSRTGAFDDPTVVSEVFDALMTECDAREDFARLNTERIISEGELDSDTAVCISVGLFESGDVDILARYAAMNMLVGSAMADEVDGDTPFPDAELGAFADLVEQCETHTPSDN